MRAEIENEIVTATITATERDLETVTETTETVLLLEETITEDDRKIELIITEAAQRIGEITIEVEKRIDVVAEADEMNTVMIEIDTTSAEKVTYMTHLQRGERTDLDHAPCHLIISSHP